MEGAQANQIPDGDQIVQISSKEFAAKYRSKREVYNLLAVDVGYYLPSYEQVSIYFLKDIVAKKKKCKCQPSFYFLIGNSLFIGIHGSEVRHIQVPQYDGLSLRDISLFLGEGHGHVFDYMPDNQEIHKVSK